MESDRGSGERQDTSLNGEGGSSLDFTEFVKRCETGQILEVEMLDGRVYYGTFQKGLILEVHSWANKEGGNLVRPSHIEALPILAAHIQRIKGSEPEAEAERTARDQVTAREIRELEEEAHRMAIPVHSYNKDSFQLYGLPTPVRGGVVVLVGESGLGKTTVFNILTGKIKPNLCEPENPHEWTEILKQFSGSEIHTYLRRIQEGSLQISTKIQDINTLRSPAFHHVRHLFLRYTKETPFLLHDLLEAFRLSPDLIRRPPAEYTDEELQLVIIAKTVLEKADVYAFDEPCRFLSGMQKRDAAKEIKKILRPDRYVFLTALPEDLTVFEEMAAKVYFIGGRAHDYGEVKERVSRDRRQ